MASSGLTVEITPSQSAFFAGDSDVFAATITFTNSARPTPLPHAVHSQPHLPLSPQPSNRQTGREHPASSSHIALAEYATSHLDRDDVPPSPFFGAAHSGQFQQGDFGTSDHHTASDVGGALPTPKSATFAPYPPSRVASGQHVASSETAFSKSTPALPTRKGLIGKPLGPVPPPVIGSHARRMSSGGPGIYAGTRKPSSLSSHFRAQSMAVSSPDLFDMQSEHVKPRSASSRLSEGSNVEPKGNAPNIVEQPPTPQLLPTLPSSSAISQSNPATKPSNESSVLPHPSTLPTSSTTSLSNSSSGASTPPTVESAISANRSAFQSLSHPYLSNLSSEKDNDLASTISLTESDLDPTDTTTTSRANFYATGKNETMDDVTKAGMEDLSSKARSNAGPSAEPSATRRAASYGDRLRSASSLSASNPFLHPPNTIMLLWSFAHLEGTFEVDDGLIKAAEFVEVKKSLVAGFGSGLGGGTLEADGAGSTGWKSWIWGGAGKEGEKTGVEKGKRAGATLEERKINTMRERTIPTFSSPPSILGVDLVLAPGESKTYSFSIRIPADLPPSFRGKAIKFSYHLVVGTNRTNLGTRIDAKAVPTEAMSRIMRVPVRIYNHVAVTGARPFYDLTNPIVYHRDEATIGGDDDAKIVIRDRRPSTGLEDFEAYTSSLLDSVVPTSPAFSTPVLDEHRPPTIMEAPPSQRPEMLRRTRADSTVTIGGEEVANEEEPVVGCKAAVEIVSRNSQKVSYDINKDGYMVATLTLVKSAYRLGETVNGSVVINSGDGRVLRVSARLETHEHIETSIATKPASQLREITRRLHAEHHETTLDSARIGFALAIPSGATPDFATSGVKLQWSVRLSFLVIPPSPDSSTSTQPAPERTSLLPFSKPKPAPFVDPKSQSKHGRSKSFAYGFEPAVPLTLPAAPMILPTGATHLMPVLGPLDTSPSHISYKAVPDLGFVPVLFSSTAWPDPTPTPGPLQRSAVAGMHRTTPSFSSMAKAPPAGVQASVVLVPAKVETVECSIPIKVYPGNTPFRPTITIFEA